MGDWTLCHGRLHHSAWWFPPKVYRVISILEHGPAASPADVPKTPGQRFTRSSMPQAQCGARRSQGTAATHRTAAAQRDETGVAQRSHRAALTFEMRADAMVGLLETLDLLDSLRDSLAATEFPSAGPR